MSVGKEWEIPLRQTHKVLSQELFLGVVALKTHIQKNHYMRDMGPFPRYGHIMLAIIMGILICYYNFLLNPKTYDI